MSVCERVRERVCVSLSVCVRETPKGEHRLGQGKSEEREKDILTPPQGGGDGAAEGDRSAAAFGMLKALRRLFKGLARRSPRYTLVRNSEEADANAAAAVHPPGGGTTPASPAPVQVGRGRRAVPAGLTACP